MDSISIIVLSIAIIFIVILSKRVDKSGEHLEKQIASNHSEIKSLENTVRDINHRLYDAERDLRDTKRELSNIKNERFYYVEVDGESIVEFFNSNVTNPVTYPQNVEYEKHVGGVSYFKTYEPLLFTHKQANHIAYLNDGVVKDTREE